MNEYDLLTKLGEQIERAELAEAAKESLEKSLDFTEKKLVRADQLIEVQTSDLSRLLSGKHKLVNTVMNLESSLEKKTNALQESENTFANVTNEANRQLLIANHNIDRLSERIKYYESILEVIRKTIPEDFRSAIKTVDACVADMAESILRDRKTWKEESIKFSNLVTTAEILKNDITELTNELECSEKNYTELELANDELGRVISEDKEIIFKLNDNIDSLNKKIENLSEENRNLMLQISQQKTVDSSPGAEEVLYNWTLKGTAKNDIFVDELPYEAEPQEFTLIHQDLPKVNSSFFFSHDLS
jgi:chromosome segregation ATPase